MKTARKKTNSLLIGALGFSVLVHVSVLIFVMNYKIPQTLPQVNFMIPPKKEARKAIILPEVPRELRPDAKSVTRKPLGVVGIIGTTSKNSSKVENNLADIFSPNSGKVSDNLSHVLKGKQRVELANKSNISTKTPRDPADIGGIVSASFGQVKSGDREKFNLPAPKVSTSKNESISESVDAQSVLSVIALKNNGFTRCYERSLKNNPELAGKMGYEISVGKEGQVSDIRFTEDSLKSKDVSECIKGILLSLVFPKPKGGAAVFSSTLVFGTH